MDTPKGDQTIRAILSNKKWPLLVIALVVITGMAYSLFWPLLIRHHNYWLQPGDFWGTYRVAHYIGWGDISSAYTPGTGFLVFPGIAVLLAPLAMLTGALGLSESFPLSIPHPSAWPVVGPIEMFLSALVLLSLDTLMERLGVKRSKRRWMLLLQAVVLWPLAVFWGHPEDGLALMFAIYAILAALDGKWRKSGWLWGLAVVFQPLTLLLLPVGLALLPAGKRLFNLVRAALPSITLVAVPLAKAWKITYFALAKQPTSIIENHPTPLLGLATFLGRAPKSYALRPERMMHNGLSTFTLTRVAVKGEILVAPGTGRLLALLIACGIGTWVAWRRPSVPELTWLASLALACWCVLEPVMTPYYLWPASALLLVGLSTARPRRILPVAGLLIFAMVWSEWRFQPWIWWGPLVVALVVALVATRPPRRATLSADASVPADADSEPSLVRILAHVGS